MKYYDTSTAMNASISEEALCFIGNFLWLSSKPRTSLSTCWCRSGLVNEASGFKCKRESGGSFGKEIFWRTKDFYDGMRFVIDKVRTFVPSKDYPSFAQATRCWAHWWKSMSFGQEMQLRLSSWAAEGLNGMLQLRLGPAKAKSSILSFYLIFQRWLLCEICCSWIRMFLAKKRSLKLGLFEMLGINGRVMETCENIHPRALHGGFCFFLLIAAHHGGWSSLGSLDLRCPPRTQGCEVHLWVFKSLLQTEKCILNSSL